MVESLVLSRKDGAIGAVSLNRPDHLNAFNLELANQFIEAVNAFGVDPDVRVIVIRGTGKVFSAGGDIKEMLGYVREGVDRAAYFRAPLAAFGKMVMAVRESPKPVIAAVHGAVAGVAFNLMLACDLKLAEENTRFTQAFIKIGLSPDGGGTWFLPRLVGYARACELAMLPSEIDAKTAQDWGLINWIAPAVTFEARLNKICKMLINGPREALRRAKLLLNSAYNRDLIQHMEAERLAQIENAAHTDFEEGLAAFIERQKPEY